MKMDFPAELKDKLAQFDDTLSQLDTNLQPLLNTPLTDLHAKVTPLDAAKVDLIAAYALNSLFWVYLNTRGENPKEHGIKQELDRIRSYMMRTKEIQDKEKAPKVDAPAAKRFVKSALWKAAHKAAKPDTLENSQEDSNSTTSQCSGGKKETDTQMIEEKCDKPEKLTKKPANSSGKSRDTRKVGDKRKIEERTEIPEKSQKKSKPKTKSKSKK
ncbi:nuclear nucleic acid-binding protein C1D-like [Tubulanus polymorphus]|uniref:nuclear nucleic acid-binding protein C1D-like n=1 Tax=Tubulanus polymorphus TaxID=672921 RepID=UPI003DA34301